MDCCILRSAVIRSGPQTPVIITNTTLVWCRLSACCLLAAQRQRTLRSPSILRSLNRNKPSRLLSSQSPAVQLAMRRKWRQPGRFMPPPAHRARPRHPAARLQRRRPLRPPPSKVPVPVGFKARLVVPAATPTPAWGHPWSTPRAVCWWRRPSV